MSVSDESQPGSRSARRWSTVDAGWAATLAFVVGLFVVRVALQMFGPAPLVEDEAWYWTWSERLEWSYATKGPGVAWLIAGATAVFGDAEWVIRLPAALCGSVGAAFVAGLAREAFGRRAMLPAAIVFASLPVAQATGSLMTIDGPLLASWAGASWAAYRALSKRGRWAWFFFGLALGLGVLFKYTALLLPLGLIAFVIVRRGHVHMAGWGWRLLCVPPLLASFAPIVIWNSEHDWISVRHLLGHLGLPGGDMPAAHAGDDEGGGWSYSPVWTLTYVAYQFALAGPAIGLMVLGVVNLVRTRRGSFGAEGGRVGPRWRAAAPAFMLCCSAPVLGMYLLVTLFTEGEANWTASAYVALSVLSGWAVCDAVTRADIPLKALYRATQVVLVGGLVGLFGLGLEARMSADLIEPGRLRGIDRLADETEALMDRLRDETGMEPFVMAIHYGRAAHLEYYLDDAAIRGGSVGVFASSAHFGDGRVTQYDLWDGTDLSRDEILLGLSARPAVLFNSSERDWLKVFDRVVPLGVLEDEPKGERPAFLGYGFKGGWFKNGPRALERRRAVPLPEGHPEVGG